MSFFGISFARPEFLWWSFAPWILYYASRWLFERRQKKIQAWIEKSQWPKMIRTPHSINAAWWCLAIWLGFIALARPLAGEEKTIQPAVGFDYMLVVDVSSSMEVEDVIPSRIRRVRKWIRDTLDRSDGDRVGLIVFAGSAHLICPLTQDLDYVREWVDQLSPKLAAVQGTEILQALDMGVKALTRGSENSDWQRTLVLITDAEAHDLDQARSSLDVILKDLKQQQIRLVLVGVGTERGGTIPERDESGQSRGLKRDRSGNPITSRLGLEALKSLSNKSGANYFLLTDNNFEFQKLLNEIRSQLSVAGKDKQQIRKKEWFQIPLLLGLLIWIITFIPLRKKKPSLPLVALCCFVFLSGCDLEIWGNMREQISLAENGRLSEGLELATHTQVLAPDNPIVANNLGVFLFSQQKMEEAKTQFGLLQDLSGSPEIQALSIFNLGSMAHIQGQLEVAEDLYAKALLKIFDQDLSGLKRHDVRVDQEFKEKLTQAIRENLERLRKQQQQKQKDKNQGKDDQGKNKKEDQEQQEGDSDKEKEKGPQSSIKNPKREFKSQNLNKEDAERVMQELSQREREVQEKIRRQKSRNQPRNLEKDW